MHLRAVIFDYGEVLSKPANQSVHQELVQATGLPLEIFETHYWANRLDYDAAILSGCTYWEKVAREAGTEFTPEKIKRLIALDARMWMDINEPMLSWAFDLQRLGLRIGILSNMGEDVLRCMRHNFPWVEKFDALVWSCELGVVKPDLAIYRHTIQQMGIRAEDALFIDNLQVNVAAAEQAGLHSLVYKDIGQLGRDLRRRNFDLPHPEPLVAS